MSGEPRLNRFLSNTTSLVRTGFLTSLLVGYTGQVVQATDITGLSGAYTMGNGETLNITTTGSINDIIGVFGSSVNATKVDNKGSIQASYGVLLDGTSTLGELVNSGTIDASFDAIKTGGGTFGILTNDAGGIIEGGDYGFRIYGAGRIDTLTNRGEIDGYLAIDLDNSSIGDLINESGGQIEGVDNAINLYASSDIDTLTNSGTISGGNNAIDLDDSSIGNLTNESGGVITADDYTIYLYGYADINTLTNSGAITATSGNAVLLDGASTIGDLANNTGATISAADAAISVESNSEIDTLTNSGTITSTNSNGVLVYNGIINELTNNSGGLIEGGYFGIYVKFSSEIGDLTNSGEIRGTNVGIRIDDGAEVGPFVNQGAISGDIGIQIDGGEISGEFTNTGTVKGTGGTAIDLKNLISDVILNLNGGSVLGDIVEDDPTSGFSHVVIGGDFATGGNITVSDIKISSGKKFTISAGDRVTVQNMKNSAGATLTFGVTDKDTAGFIDVVGAGEGIDLTDMTATVSATTASLAAGDEIQVGAGQAAVIGMTGVTGQEATEIEDTSILWNFELVDGSQDLVTGSVSSYDLYLVVSKAMNLNDAAGGSNNKNAAKVLDTLSNSTNPEIQQIWTALNGAETEEEINQILEATQSDVGGGGVSAANLNANTSFDITSNRLLSVRSNNVAGSGISSGDLTEGLQLWVQGFGQVGEQSERDSVAGFDLTSYGFAAGVDTEKLVDDAVVGAAIGYGSSFIESDGASAAETDINSYQLTLYADYALPNQMFVNGMMAYAYHDNETRRVPGAGLVAEADYAAHQYVARLEMGRDFTVGDFTLSPSGLAQVSHYNPDGYTETGAGGANLSVEQDATNVAELGAGLDVTWAYQPTSGGRLETTVGAQYRYDFIGEAVSTTSSFAGGGSAIQSDGFDPAQSTVDLGVGVRYQMNDSWELAAQYDFEYKDDYRAHIGSVRAAYSF